VNAKEGHIFQAPFENFGIAKSSGPNTGVQGKRPESSIGVQGVGALEPQILLGNPLWYPKNLDDCGHTPLKPMDFLQNPQSTIV